MELAEVEKRYCLDIVGISSTKSRGSGTVDLDGGWKLFYSGVDPKMSACGCGYTHKPSNVRLCVRMDSFGITGLYVETHCAEQNIMLVSSVCSQCYK